MFSEHYNNSTQNEKRYMGYVSHILVNFFLRMKANSFNKTCKLIYLWVLNKFCTKMDGTTNKP